MPRSRADERLVARVRREAPDAPEAKVDVEDVIGRLLKAQPESREARKAKTTAGRPKR